jgi:hypothetical protein
VGPNGVEDYGKAALPGEIKLVAQDHGLFREARTTLPGDAPIESTLPDRDGAVIKGLGQGVEGPEPIGGV